MIINLLCRVSPELHALLGEKDLLTFSEEITSIAVNGLSEALAEKSVTPTPDCMERLLDSIVEGFLPKNGTMSVQCRFANPTMIVVDVTPTCKVQTKASRLLH